MATYRIESALAVLRLLLLDTWSRLESRQAVMPELSERVHILQLGPSLCSAGAFDYDPPLPDTWTLIGEENEEDRDEEFELALCISALADFSWRTEEMTDTAEQHAIGMLAGLRGLWSEFVPAPIGWQPDYLAPEDRYVFSDLAFADSFLLRRYQGLIARLDLSHPPEGP